MITAAIRKVRMSAVGKEYSRPSRPKKSGRMMGRATPRMISRVSVAARPTMASAALDAETARTVTDSLLNLKGLTRVAVTQRLEPSALSRYDGIIVMKNGRVSDQGSFDGLMEAKNQFYALFVLANG